ncbi:MULTISPECIES: efflux RND transporter permease subunit [Faecalibacterium]|jgi:multidrug efflux pump subunit AcrB|uniref:efflux RND transporter permease subunit n=1 Tax=Faecalibacterium TaxID=216851 RepID=UPI000E46701B|nr:MULTISPECIES: efflux RND transporter permease subunit [Faecalibacterium]RHQ24729.1 AcrB/AcrD/AcrF family protein [Faecalibacterium sp. AF28-13AC]
MEKFSVKKPFTVLVAVIMVLMLGFVSISNMQTNLLPDVNTPYLMVVTVYPGASPERVESEVSDVMQNALGTVAGVEKVTATSAENYSLLLMQFSDDTDMNSAMVKVSNKVDQTTASLPSSCLTPSIIEYSLNMNAFMTAAVSREGSDVYDLSEFVSDTLVPYVERKGGVSSVSANGLIEKMVQVQLSQEKIDAINEKLLEVIDVQLADARKQLESAEAQIEAGRKEYDRQFKNYNKTVSDTVMQQFSGQVGEAVETVRKQAQALLDSVNQLIAVVQEPEIQQALIDVRDGLQRVMDKFNETGMKDIDSLIEIVAELRDITDKLTGALQQLQQRLNTESGTEGSTAADLADDLQVQQSLNTIYNTLNDVIKAMDDVPGLMSTFSDALGTYSQQQMQAYMKFTEAREMLNEYEKQLAEAKQTYADAEEKAMASSDVSKLLDIDTLAQLIYAQNFSMPAGYVKDSSGKSWLLKVGEEYDSIEDISGALLLHVDGFGDVRLSDVADVEVIDNAEASYTRLNGERAAVLKIYKGATSSASEVSDNCLSAFQELEAQYDGLHVVVLSNQGNYITIIVKSILSSMVIGAALAIIVLAIFLRDVKPTLVVGFSIPLSVLFAVVLMYFTGMDLNVMTLAGLSLGIGMLVDNSIVVIENIYRLRGRGVPAARAAVQGAKQVGMSVVASTLTSVCVFLPVVFSSSIVKSLMQPMSLCIGYCLMASLIVALTVVPAAASTVLKKAEPKQLKWFDKIQDKYAKSLEWCFRHRALPLLAAVVLLAFCGWRVFSMGVELLPTITSNEAIVTLSTTKDLSKEDSYAIAGKAVEAMLEVDHVEEVGITTDTRVAGMDIGQLGLPTTITDLLNAANSYGTYQVNVMLDESLSSSEIETARQALEDALSGIEDCTAKVEISGMQELTSQLASGLSVKIYGADSETLSQLSEKVVDIVNDTEGFANATNGLGSGDATINLHIDRDKVRSYGLTVAQVYQQIAAKLTTTTTAQTPVTVDGSTMSVQISNNLDPVTKENMMDITFETTVMSADGTTSTGTCTLADMATWDTGSAPDSITSEDQTQYVSVTADTLDGYNTTVQARVLEKKLNEFALSDEMPEGCSFSMGGESDSVNFMVNEMVQWLGLALPFVYLVMVAQFQSLLSPFIVLFTIPLAFTGGLLGMLFTGQQLTMISLMGFIVLMGTVVNNGIVFVDYANQLRLGGMERRAALIATGKTRMRPILMTTLTTVLAMLQLVFSNDMASQLMSGMAIVIICGLSYATLMTLYIVPILYDILFRKPPLNVDVGSDDELDDIPDDAAEYIAQASSAQPEG